MKLTDAKLRTLTAPGKLSWWHKTIGTMYHLAERSPAFSLSSSRRRASLTT